LIKDNLRKETGVKINSVRQLFSHRSVREKFRRNKYEIADKGPEFMRCAIKTTQLLNVMHLSLPDNLLGLTEAQLIGGMIRKNTPLQVLNLKRNNFDHECGLIIGDSLLYNSNLRSLDMSENRLGDLGVRNLLSGLLMKGLTRARGDEGEARVEEAKLELERPPHVEAATPTSTKRARTHRAKG
jgi:hypothetical protein